MSPLPPVSVAVRMTYSIQDWTRYSWPQLPPGMSVAFKPVLACQSNDMTVLLLLLYYFHFQLPLQLVSGAVFHSTSLLHF